MRIIKMVALDIDGVALKDTFSIILRKITEEFNLKYTAEIERNIFSRPQQEGAKYFIDTFKIDNYTPDSLIDKFFNVRERYLEKHPNTPVKGLGDFLNLLKSLHLKIICYGGLSKEYFQEELRDYVKDFLDYICTNDFRPGIKEITKDIYKLNYNQILFIDDVNTVAEKAKLYNVPFIGVPSTEFQKMDMSRTKVKYLVSSIRDINSDLLIKIDRDAIAGTIWT